MKQTPPANAALKAVFERIGGEGPLGEILFDFYQRMSRDVMIGFFFQGKDLRAISTQQKNFFMRAAGVSTVYEGNPPSRAHDKIPPILPGHFDRRLIILEATLRERGLGDEDIRSWLAFENAFRDQVVSRQ